MANIIANSRIFAGEYNNYLVGGNICNGFAIGEIGSTTDFFIVASEPEGESNYPLITGNFLDSDGKVLFRLVENMLSINPGKCKKILSDHIGYEIFDSNGVKILKVRTTFEEIAGLNDECFVTSLEGSFYNSSGSLIAQAGEASTNMSIDPSSKAVVGFGVGNSFGLVQNFSDDELDLLRLVVKTKGKVHRILSGEIQSEKVSLDGCMLSNVSLRDCEIEIATGEFVIGPAVSIINCNFAFYGAAGQVKTIINEIIQSTTTPAFDDQPTSGK